MPKATLRFVRTGLRLALVMATVPGLAQFPQQSGAGGSTSSSSLPLSSQPGRNPSAPASGSLSAVPEDFSDLRLAPGFLLDVQVYDNPDLASQPRVAQDGNITLPFVGAIHVAGDSLAQAQAAIAEKLKQGEILKDPQVSVNVLQYAASNITVLGEVQTPGRLQLLAPHSLRDVLAMAGGETNLAGDTVQVKHPDANGAETTSTYEYARNSNGDTIRNVMVQPGDTVVVERAGIVYVMGAVNRPGGYVMQEDGKLDVAQAISMAQGTTLQAKVGGLRVVRRNADGTVRDIPLSYKKITEGKEKPLELQPEDVVYVPVSHIKSAFIASSTIVGETASASIYAVH
jgi:polysaccharide export outer membrane protein